MQTTLDLDEKLLEAAQQRAADQGTTLTAVIEEALSAVLTPAPQKAEPYKLNWKPHRGGILTGVDITNRDSLYDIMDGLDTHGNDDR